VSWRGKPINGANPGVAMVFQSFALLPWLTVRANTEMGLEARGVPLAERRKRALDLIDLIGLDGFEQAYPRELPGGMRQRVGRDGLPKLARILTLEVNDLLPIVDAAEMLGFATVADADIELIPEGRALVGADILTSNGAGTASYPTTLPTTAN